MTLNLMFGSSGKWTILAHPLANQIAASAPKGHVTFRGQIGVVRMRREQLAGVFYEQLAGGLLFFDQGVMYYCVIGVYSVCLVFTLFVYLIRLLTFCMFTVYFVCLLFDPFTYILYCLFILFV